MRHIIRISAWLVLVVASLSAQSPKPMTVQDLLSMRRVTDPQISPDGRWVAFTVTDHSSDENKTNSNIFLIPFDGGAVLPLTSAKGSNASPRWLSPTTIAFVSTRDGESQIWMIPITGGEARKLTSLSTEASGLVVSRDGKYLAFASDVFPECPDDDCNRERAERESQQKSRAKVFDHLPYRVWNSWKDGRRSHVFVQTVEGGPVRDLTPGDHDVPPIDLGGSWDYAFSPDGSEVTFTMNTDPLVATSTNNDLFTVGSGGGTARRITTNPANDAQPTYSPDGKSIAYQAMERAGFEADQRRLVIYDRSTGSRRTITGPADISVGEIVWAPDGKTIYCTADYRGSRAIFRIALGDGTVTPILTVGTNSGLRISPDGRSLVFTHDRIDRPTDVYRMDVNGKNLTRLTSFNEDRMKTLKVQAMEDFWFEGAGGTRVHGMLVKPPEFAPGSRYPLVYLIHGGPQGQWMDQFHYRWSAQLFASRGYVVVMVNPRGSTGYGQPFTDAISRDWGGLVYEDLMKGLDHVTKTYEYVDETRIAAAGASYGGYMVNWMLGSTDRFRCFVSHDGVFNPWSMYGTTEELWFTEWEFGGTPYTHPELYDRWSPLRKAAAFRTPTLVVHGQQDFRVDVSEGFQLFTALQRQGVPSKMLYFPDEGHWVMRPANAVVWYTTVLDWIDTHTK